MRLHRERTGAVARYRWERSTLSVVPGSRRSAATEVAGHHGMAARHEACSRAAKTHGAPKVPDAPWRSRRKSARVRMRACRLQRAFGAAVRADEGGGRPCGGTGPSSSPLCVRCWRWG